MVKHIILWKLKETLTDKEKSDIKTNAKINLENLSGQIDGLNRIEVTINALESSNADMMLYTEFTNATALTAYQKNPLHVNVADKYVRPFTVQRLCLDTE